MRLADLLPPQGGRVSAHYGESTTIGGDRTGQVVLTGAKSKVVATVAALCRRPDATGSIVDPSERQTFSRTPQEFWQGCAMPVRTLLTLVAALAGLTFLAPQASAQEGCSVEAVQQALFAAGQLSQDDIDGGVAVDLVRCGDVTDDGVTDAVYTLSSGGTAGDTQFGVLRGNADNTLGKRVLNKKGYKIGIARHNRKSFDVMQPFYKSTDANCCPSSFRQTRYSWTGTKFKAGKAKKLKKAPARFYRP